MEILVSFRALEYRFEYSDSKVRRDSRRSTPMNTWRPGSGCFVYTRSACIVRAVLLSLCFTVVSWSTTCFCFMPPKSWVPVLSRFGALSLCLIVGSERAASADERSGVRTVVPLYLRQARSSSSSEICWGTGVCTSCVSCCRCRCDLHWRYRYGGRWI